MTRVDKGSETGTMATMDTFLRTHHDDGIVPEDTAVFGPSTSNKVYHFNSSYRLSSNKLQRQMPALMETWTSPKFITCPDCGERYDHAKRRRLIDTCGHPRCYACLFIDNPCPLCLKLPISPRSRSTSFNKDGFRGSHDSLLKEAAKQRASSDTDAKYFKGSHPNLSELHKIRASTLPHSGFRTDSYFRSLYKYDPSSQESLTDQTTENQKEVKKDRPRSVNLPNYNTSLDNLHEKFWKSVQRTSRPGSPTSPGNNLPPSPLAKPSNSTSPKDTSHVTDENIQARLTVTGPRVRSRTTDSPWETEAVRQSLIEVPHRTLGPRPRSASDLMAKLTIEAEIQNELAAKRYHHGNNREGQLQRALSSSPPQLRVSIMTGTSQSDRSSDASSVRASDSWSESSGEEEIIFPRELTSQPETTALSQTHCDTRAKGKEKYESPDDTESPQVKEARANCKKSVYSSFANTTYWVMDSAQNSNECPNRVHQGPISNGTQVFTNGNARTKVSTL